MVLPSFGAYTGGLDVRDAAIAGLFAPGFLTYMLGAARVYAIAA
jgi:metallophosphoesterase superfamily enzyme